MSPEHDQEYFSDGIAEELLNRLAQIPDLRVAARTSAFQFKGKNLDIADIGRQLKVAHVLEGSVRKSGTRLRITAQLINSASGYHLWSQTFEGDARRLQGAGRHLHGDRRRAGDCWRPSGGGQAGRCRPQPMTTPARSALPHGG
jgi:hypothetical protein